MSAVFPDNIITKIAEAAIKSGDTQTVGRLAVLATRFAPAIQTILYRRLTIKSHKFDKLVAALLPGHSADDDETADRKAMLRVKVTAMDLEGLPDHFQLLDWCKGIRICFEKHDIIALSNTALQKLAGPTEPQTTPVSTRTIFPNLKTITVAAGYLEFLTMFILAQSTYPYDSEELMVFTFFSNMLTYGAVEITLFVDLDWRMDKARFIRLMRGRGCDGCMMAEGGRPKEEAEALWADNNIETMRTNIGLKSLFRDRIPVHRISFHSVWYNSHIPVDLRADHVTIEFAEHAGLSLADDYQPFPVCFKRILQFHNSSIKKIDWSIYKLHYDALKNVKENEEIAETEGFLDGLRFEKGKNPLCIWDHEEESK